MLQVRRESMDLVTLLIIILVVVLILALVGGTRGRFGRW
jgi:hypothetical protein